MTQNILYDVRTCLNDALDTMFNSEQSQITSGNNDTDSAVISSNSGLFPAEALKSMMNKRKSEDNDEEIHQQNGDGNIKRLCATNGDQPEQKM